MGLGTWAAFKEANAGAMVMGDTVLFEMKAMQWCQLHSKTVLVSQRCTTTSSSMSPRFTSCTSEGEDSVDRLAGAVKKMYDTIKAVRDSNAKPGRFFATVGRPPRPEKSSITAGPLNEIYSAHKGRSKTAW
jgi:hypothetical protein